MLVGGADHVYVAVEQQRWRLTPPGQARDQIGTLWVLAQQGGPEARLSQQVIDIADALRFVPRRIRSVETDEILE